MDSEPLGQLELTVKVLKVGQDKAIPILATFPQNIPERKDEHSFELLRKRRGSSIRSIDSPIPMVGRWKPQLDSGRYLLGFIDEEKGRLNVVPVLETFQVSRFLEQDRKGDLVGLDTRAEGMEHREMIVQEIGTKKGKKILQQIKNKVIQEDHIFSANEVKDLILNKAEEIQNQQDKTDETFFVRELQRKKELLPEFNLSAKSASKIYSIDGLMPPAEIAKMNPGLINDARFITNYCKVLKEQINWKDLSPEQTKQKEQLLVYLNCMMIFYKIRKITSPVQEVASSHKIPLEVAKGIVDRFYEAVKKNADSDEVAFTRSKKQENRLICHLIILALTICNYKIDASPLMAALRIEEERINLLAREIGCTINKTDKSLIIKLRKIRVESEDRYEKRAKDDKK